MQPISNSNKRKLEEEITLNTPANKKVKLWEAEYTWIDLNEDILGNIACFLPARSLIAFQEATQAAKNSDLERSYQNFYKGVEQRGWASLVQRTKSLRFSICKDENQSDQWNYYLTKFIQAYIITATDPMINGLEFEKLK